MEKNENNYSGENRQVNALIERIKLGESSYDLFKILKDIATIYCFTRFVVMNKIANEHEYDLAKLITLTNWEPEFIKASDALQVIRRASVYEKLSAVFLPVVWKLETANQERNEEKRKAFQKLCVRFKHRNGVSFPVIDHCGIRGVIGFTGDRDDPSQQEIMELSFLTTHVYDRLSKLMKPESHSIPNLTDREVESIYWASLGKTSAEAAIIMGLKENTLNHYLTKSALKLGSVNKAHTVAKSIRLGLIKD